MDEIYSCIICIAASILFVIIDSIKDGENILESLYSFWLDWWKHIKAGALFLFILLLISYVISR